MFRTMYRKRKAHNRFGIKLGDMSLGFHAFRHSFYVFSPLFARVYVRAFGSGRSHLTVA